MRVFLVNIRIVLTALVTWLATAATAKADFEITVGSTTLSTGGTGIVDIYITSNSSTGNQLGSFQLQLTTSVISSPSSDGLNASFTASQPSVYNQSNYVFFGSSAAQDYGFPFWASPTSTVTNNDTIVGGDFNDSTLGYTNIKQGTTYLLAQLQVYNPGQAGDVFSVALSPASGSGNGQTYFQDSNGNNIDFSSTAGTITTLNLPEPSTPVLAGIGSLCCLFFTWLSRRQARKSLHVAA